MAAKSLSCLRLVCILSGIVYPAFAARLGEQQLSVLKVRQFDLFLASKLTWCTDIAVLGSFLGL